MGSTWIVIVNYRTAELTVDALRVRSAQVTDLGSGRVLVVDNDSGDGSVEKLTGAIEREGWSGWASVMSLDRNGGFAHGNKAGIRATLASIRRCHSFSASNYNGTRQSHSGRAG